MNTRAIIILLILIGLLCAGCAKNDCPSEAITPNTVQQVEPITSFTPKRVADLTNIVIALEKYKQKHRSYPISQEGGRKWNRMIDVNGNIDHQWISGLAPEFIKSLPEDPRNDKVFDHQYAYRSNGAHYKLIAFKPEDCKFVRARNRSLIDRRPTCVAYGFWTRRAANWL